ncbi:hypothetical protein [Acidisoma sp. 7E03]
MTEQQLQRGDVVACAGRYFVVWKVTAAEVEAFPICFDPAATFGPFRVSIGEELVGWGITDEHAAVVAGQREVLTCTAPLRAIRVGRCSGGLICRIIGAAARADAARFVADRGRRECNNNSDTTATLAAAE